MINRKSFAVCTALAVTLAFPLAAAAAPGDEIPMDVTVQFGQFKFPQDAAPLNHFLDPEEVTIRRGGTVTFEFNGAGHAIAIYQVSADTQRSDIVEDLCLPDPATCFPQGAATANLRYKLTDATGFVVVDTDTNPPDNRVNDPIGRLVYGGGPVFFTGRTTAEAPAPVVEYRFERAGRYLVICADRNHLINSHMFGFVNVVRKRFMTSSADADE